MATAGHALLLTAGLGTRLLPLTLARAKPALPVAGEPLVRRIIGWLRHNGFTELVLNLHHLPATIAREVGDGSDLGVRARYSWEQPAVLGTAGGPRHALDLIAADAFLIVNGDTLTDVDAAALASAHAASGALVTLAVVPNTEPERYGGVRMDDSLWVTGFVPPGRAAAGSYHFVGVQMAQAAAFRDLPAGRPASSIGGAYDRLIAHDRRAVRAFIAETAFWDIGTIADYWQTSRTLGRGRQAEGRRCRIDPAATVRESILWDDVVVGAGATLDECIVADAVRVPEGAAFRRTVLVQHGGRLLTEPF